MEATHSIEHQSESMYTTFTIILWTMAGIGQILETINIESAWIWAFRALSGISVLLVIVINWPKAKEILFKKKKNESNRNRKKSKGN